jgi:hypothetical protein
VSYLNSLVLDLVFSKNISVQWGVFQTVVIKQNMRVVTGLCFFARRYLLVTGMTCINSKCMRETRRVLLVLLLRHTHCVLPY